MGRGRAKAKQTKVARELKYSSGGIDIDRLRADLGANGSPAFAGASSSPAKSADHDVDGYGVDVDVDAVDSDDEHDPHDPYAPHHHGHLPEDDHED